MIKCRTAACTISWRFEKNLPEIIEQVAPLGLDGLEIWAPHLTTCSITRVHTLLARHDLSVLCLSAPWGIRFWEHEEALLYYASAVWARGIKVFGDTADREVLVPRLRSFCQQAGKIGLTVLLENHDNQPHDTVENTLSLVREAEAPNLKVIFDVWNSRAMGEDVLEAFNQYRPWLGHLHLKWGVTDEKGAFQVRSLRKAPPGYFEIVRQARELPVWFSFEMMKENGMIQEGLEALLG